MIWKIDFSHFLIKISLEFETKLSIKANIPKNVSTADVFVCSLTLDEKTQLKTKTHLFLRRPSVIKVPTTVEKEKNLALLLEFSTYIFCW